LYHWSHYGICRIHLSLRLPGKAIVASYGGIAYWEQMFRRSLADAVFFGHALNFCIAGPVSIGLRSLGYVMLVVCYSRPATKGGHV